MKLHPDNRSSSAIYWSAVSLIVCEGLPIDKAAERLGVDADRLRDLLNERQSLLHRAEGFGGKPSNRMMVT